MEKWYDLLLRIIGVVVVLPLFAIIFFVGGFLFKLGVFLFMLILYYEIYRLVLNRFSILTFVAGIIALSISYWQGGFILSFILLLIFGLLNYLMGFSIKEALMLMALMVYILVPANILLMLRETSLFLASYVLITNWSYDTGAYMFGRFFGRRKIFRSVSGGKTLEGLLGGLLVSGVVGGILGSFVDITRVHLYFLTGIYIGVFAQLGDLIESALKREKGVKDAGSILPGHGGLFDRVDSLILSLAGFYVIFRVFGLFK